MESPPNPWRVASRAIPPSQLKASAKLRLAQIQGQTKPHFKLALGKILMLNLAASGAIWLICKAMMILVKAMLQA